MIKQREASKILKSMVTGKYLDPKKVKGHPRGRDLLHYFVRNRLPLMEELIDDKETADWLFCMGYGYYFVTPEPANLKMVCNGDWYARSVVETGKAQPLKHWSFNNS